MYWLVAGLLILGAICGATIRLMVFIGVLFGAAVVGAVTEASHGVGASLLTALIAVLALQVGYAGGFVLRAAIRSLHRRTGTRQEGARTVR